MSNQKLKSIGAVLVGFLTVFFFSSGTDSLLEKAGILPPPSQGGLYDDNLLLLALAYRSIYTLMGGYFTAHLAPNNPMKHVKILAVIGLVGGLVGVIAGWNLSHHWYPIALAVTGPLFVLLGGKLRLQWRGFLTMKKGEN